MHTMYYLLELLLRNPKVFASWRKLDHMELWGPNAHFYSFLLCSPLSLPSLKCTLPSWEQGKMCLEISAPRTEWGPKGAPGPSTVPGSSQGRGTSQGHFAAPVVGRKQTQGCWSLKGAMPFPPAAPRLPSQWSLRVTEADHSCQHFLWCKGWGCSGEECRVVAGIWDFSIQVLWEP